MSNATSRRPLVLAGAILAAALVVGGLLLWLVPGKSEPEAPQTFKLRGQITLAVDGTFSMNPRCGGKGGFEDINVGAAVVVYDASDKVLATGRLDEGVFTSQRIDAPCAFSFTVSEVPRGEKFYQVQVSHRGKIPVQAADAEAGKTALTIG